MNDFAIFTRAYLCKQGHQKVFGYRWVKITNISIILNKKHNDKQYLKIAITYNVRELVFSSNEESIFLLNVYSNNLFKKDNLKVITQR